MEEQKLKILIADDEVSVREPLEFILTDSGFEVVSVSNGKSALKKARESFYNLAVLDYKMADIDGVELGRKIKEINNDTRIILLTDKATLGSAIAVAKGKGYDYLTKPVAPDELIELINNALEKQHLIMENKRLLWELKKTNIEHERLNKFQDGLIEMISHDLRSPISSLTGFNYALLQGVDRELTEKQKEIINAENESIEVMMNLINNLLDIKQIESRKLLMKKKYVDIKETVIEPLVKRMAPQLNKREIDIRVVCPEKLPEVRIDAMRIGQVVQNLLNNAIKFTEKKDKIEIAVKKMNNESIRISVSDTGKGIPKESLNSIFQTFSTADNISRSRESTGRGLGLAICKEIVRAHSGFIWAESEGPGNGSSFVMVLPIDGGKDSEQE